jgi:riboflavin kinase/FMN adenylyltransferase
MTLDLPAIGPAVITLGVFDGVHRGHRSIAAATRAAATERGASAVALAFDPPPAEVIRPGTRLPRLLPVDLVLERMRGAGIDHAAVVRFDDALRGLSPEGFLDALQPAIEVRGVVMTAGSAFGRDRAGTVEHITALGRHRGFDVVEAPTMLDDGEPVSSSRIRIALANGDIAVANRLLGAPPFLRGTVVHGDGRGRDLGFPTANLAFDYTPALPALGIYLGTVTVPDRPVSVGHRSLVSIGVRPTFEDSGRVLVEVYLLDWEGDLYDAQMCVELGTRLRGEERFASVEALVEQMQADEVQARELFEGAARGG